MFDFTYMLFMSNYFISTRTRQYDFDLSVRRIFFVEDFMGICVYVYMCRCNLLLWKKWKKVRRWSMKQRSLDLWYIWVILSDYIHYQLLINWQIHIYAPACIYLYTYVIFPSIVLPLQRWYVSVTQNDEGY